MATTQFLSPHLMDLLMAKVMIKAERTKDRVPGGSPGNLDHPSGDDRVECDFAGRPSAYNQWQLHPNARRVALGGLAAGAAVVGTVLRKR